MKKSIGLIIFFVFYSTLLFSQKSEKNYILALSVDLYMNTSFRVECDDFEGVFKNKLSINAIWQSDSIAMFSSFVQKSKYAKHNRGLDVRCKFVYEPDENHTTTVCSDGHDILINGQLIKRNRKFIDFLISIVQAKRPSLST